MINDTDDNNDFNININNDDEIDRLLDKNSFKRKFTSFSFNSNLLKDYNDDNIKRNLYKENVDKIKLYDEIFNSKNNDENIIFFKDILKLREIKKIDDLNEESETLNPDSSLSNKNLLSLSSLKSEIDIIEKSRKKPLYKRNTTKSVITSFSNENTSSLGGYQFNVAFIGDLDVGKTELLHRECGNFNFNMKQKLSNDYVYLFVILNIGIEQNENLTKNQRIIKFYVRFNNNKKNIL